MSRLPSLQSGEEEDQEGEEEDEEVYDEGEATGVSLGTGMIDDAIVLE